MISICIPTYKRPQQLQTLLHTLLTAVAHPEPIEIVICDNDAGRSAEAVVDAASKPADVPVRYFNEPEQNISIARNRTIKEARGNWIAFIDDDEMPTPAWLTHLYETAVACNADGVFGPVQSVLPDGAPEWVRTGDFFPTVHITTGAAITVANAAAGNALVKSEILRRVNGPFDPRYGRSGGEDTFLFGTLLAKHNARFFGCREAKAIENIGLARCTRSWLVRRAFRGGLVWAKIEAELKDAPIPKYLRSASALGILLVLSPLAVMCLPFQASKSTRVLQQTAARLGQFCSALPIHYVEYR